MADPGDDTFLQLFDGRADFDLAGFSATNQVILTALQTYGMLLADNGSPWFLSGAPDEEAATEGAGYTYYRVVLSGDVTVDDKLGTYRCEAAEAEYPGGLRVPFGGVPDVGIEVDCHAFSFQPVPALVRLRPSALATSEP